MVTEGTLCQRKKFSTCDVHPSVPFSLLFHLLNFFLFDSVGLFCIGFYRMLNDGLLITRNFHNGLISNLGERRSFYFFSEVPNIYSFESTFVMVTVKTCKRQLKVEKILKKDYTPLMVFLTLDE